MDAYDKFVENAESIRKFDAVMYMITHSLFKEPTSYKIHDICYFINKMSVDVIDEGVEYTGSFDIFDGLTHENYCGTFEIEYQSTDIDFFDYYHITIDYPETRYDYDFYITE